MSFKAADGLVVDLLSTAALTGHEGMEEENCVHSFCWVDVFVTSFAKLTSSLRSVFTATLLIKHYA